jgi:hypothetical protein
MRASIYLHGEQHQGKKPKTGSRLQYPLLIRRSTQFITLSNDQRQSPSKTSSGNLRNTNVLNAEEIRP